MSRMRLWSHALPTPDLTSSITKTGKLRHLCSVANQSLVSHWAAKLVNVGFVNFTDECHSRHVGYAFNWENNTVKDNMETSFETIKKKTYYCSLLTYNVSTYTVCCELVTSATFQEIVNSDQIRCTGMLVKLGGPNHEVDEKISTLSSLSCFKLMSLNPHGDTTESEWQNSILLRWLKIYLSVFISFYIHLVIWHRFTVFLCWLRENRALSSCMLFGELYEILISKHIPLFVHKSNVK